MEQWFRTDTSKWSLAKTVNYTSSHARGKISLPIPGRVLLTILLQFKVRPAVVSMTDTSTALVDMLIVDNLKIYAHTIQKTIDGVESTSIQFQVVK